MTSWMKERDRLVEQTMAFVQGVAAQRSIATDLAEVVLPEQTPILAVESSVETKTTPKNPSSDASLVEAEALMSLIAMSLPSLRPEATNRSEGMASNAEPTPMVLPASPPAGPAASQVPIYVPVPRRTHLSDVPEREMIAQRVAKFQAGQLRFIREREDQYATAQAKIRATLGNDPQG